MREMHRLAVGRGRLRFGLVLLAWACLSWSVAAQEAPAPQQSPVIREITVSGNEQVPEEEILRAMTHTKVGAPLDVQALQQDLQAIVEIGHFESVEPRFEELLGGGMRIVVQVDEFPAVQEVRVEADVPVEAFVRDRLNVEQGRILNFNDLLDSLRTAMADVQSEVGYLVDATGIEVLDDGVVVVRLQALQVGEVAVVGNEKTRDAVIEREIRLSPGDVFSWQSVIDDQRRILNLGFFQEVDPQLSAVEDDPSKLRVTYVVSEQQTGMATFGAGYSSNDGLIGYVDVSDRNLFGRGQTAGLRWEFGQQTTGYSLNFREPYLFGHPLSLGTRLYNERDVNAGTGSEDGYTEHSYGGELELGYPIGAFTRASFALRAQDTSVTFEPGSGSEDESERTRSVTLGTRTNTADHPFHPSQGYRANLAVEAARPFFGGDTDFTKYTAEYSRYVGIGSANHVIAARLSAGVTDGTLPFSEAFRIGGGDSVRGYRYGEMRGAHRLFANLEYRFKLLDFLHGVVFADAGQAWDTLDAVDLDEMKAGYGLGVRLDTAIGPMRLDYGWNEDGQGQMYFSLGPSF